MTESEECVELLSDNQEEEEEEEEEEKEKASEGSLDTFHGESASNRSDDPLTLEPLYDGTLVVVETEGARLAKLNCTPVI